MTDSAQSDGAPAVAEGGSTVAEGRRAAGTPVRIRLRGKDITVTPERVADAGEIDQLLMTMTAANPRAAAFIGVGRDADGHFDRGRPAERHPVRLPDRSLASGGS